jgi:hypothetical protein
MMDMCDNILARGDVSEEDADFAQKVRGYINKRAEWPTGKDREIVSAAVVSGMLPTFHGGSSEEEAGAALLRLIRANAKSSLKTSWGNLL